MAVKVALGNSTYDTYEKVNLRAGAYDRANKTLYVGQGGHADGMAEAGGSPNDNCPGVTLRESETSLYWSNDSQSLPKALTQEEIIEIQEALEVEFPTKTVIYVE